MDIPTFVVNVIAETAWPATVLAVVIMLREPIGRLLLSLQHVRYKDAEFDFRKALTEVRDDESETTQPPPIADHQLRLAELSPRGAILEAWLELEDELAKAADREGIKRERPGGIYGKPTAVDSWSLAQELHVTGNLSESEIERFQKLRTIRNNAVHATDSGISKEDAETFLRLVAELRLEIKNG